MPLLTPGEMLTLAGMVITAVSAFAAVREQTKGLKEGQGEVLRQLGALHKRLDHISGEVNRIDKNHVRLEERIFALKDSQRFHVRSRLAVAEAEDAGEPPMFRDEGQE